MGVSGPFGVLLTFIITNVLGALLDKGIVQIDITIDSLQEAMKSKAWRKEALSVYNEAIGKVHTEEQKNVIRKQYQDILSRYATFVK